MSCSFTVQFFAKISFNGSDQISWTPSESIPDGVYFAWLAGEPGNTLKFMVIL